MPEIRSLTESGIEQFRRYCCLLKDQPSADPPYWLLCDPVHSVAVSGSAFVESRGFGSKYEFGQYFHGQVHGRIPVQILRNSAGIWAWMALFYLDALSSFANGKRKMLAIEKYIASSKDIREGLDKHLLYFPWKLVSLHADAVAWMLYTPLRDDTKFLRELANSYRRNVRKEFLDLAKTVFYDDRNRKFKRGATANGSKRPGTLRRLDRVADQLDMTFDIFGLQASELVYLLPAEFDRWRPRNK